MNADDAALELSGDRHVLLSGDVAFLSDVADHAQSVLLVISMPDMRIAYANRAARRAARREACEIGGVLAIGAFPFIDPVRLACPAPSLDHAVADRQGDAVTWWDVSYVALASAGADRTAMLVSAVDVTHHVLARADAEAARDTLDALLAYIPEGISISHGPDIHVDRVSARGMALVGRSAAELTGHSALQQTGVWDVFQPGSDVPLAPADRPLARATRTGAVTMNETLIVRRADGGMVTLLCNSGPIFDTAGRVTGAVMAWQDVSELQRAQAAMRESEERLRAVLLQIPAAIFIVEAPDARMTFKSRLLDEVLGHPDPDLEAAKAGLRGWALHRDGARFTTARRSGRSRWRSGVATAG
jgi:PAS domain S-box-containing protein